MTMSAVSERPLAKAATRPVPGGGQESDAAIASGAQVLQSIHLPQVSLAVWQRTLPDAVEHPLVALGRLMPLHHMFEVSPDARVEPALEAALRQFGDTSMPAYAAWRADLLALLTLARGLGPGVNLRMRLETKANAGCSVFHVDHVALRLICTYRGQGTQWLPEGTFDRRALGRGNNDHVRDWSTVQQIAKGHVAVMKGHRFPGGPRRALVHRSPPSPPAFPRLLCVIDIELS